MNLRELKKLSDRELEELFEKNIGHCMIAHQGTLRNNGYQWDCPRCRIIKVMTNREYNEPTHGVKNEVSTLANNC
jgi:hypothetical protein